MAYVIVSNLTSIKLDKFVANYEDQIGGSESPMLAQLLSLATYHGLLVRCKFKVSQTERIRGDNVISKPQILSLPNKTAPRSAGAPHLQTIHLLTIHIRVRLIFYKTITLVTAVILISIHTLKYYSYQSDSTKIRIEHNN